MNYVLLDAGNVVAARSRVASAFGEEDGFSVIATEAWPEPGMIFADGDFNPAPIPLGVLKARKSTDAMAERDRRIDGGFDFGGVRYQSRVGDRENISGAAQLALQAIILDDAQPGDTRWHGGADPFVWIAEDNSEVPMDAQTVIAFSKAAAAMKTACIFNAQALKAAIDESEDAAEVDAVDLAAGWPA